MSELTREDLLKHLRDALSHLHDADYLRQSPLAALFGVANRVDTSLAVRNTLIRAIESLKPDGSGASAAGAWNLYDALHCYYVQRVSQQVVADQLAVSVRHLRRELRAALEVLADRLCEQYNLGKLNAGAAPATPEVQEASLGEDLAWLKDAPPDRATDYVEALQAALSLAQPLAEQHHVRLDVQTAADLPRLAAHPVAVNQILLSLLATAIPQARGLSVCVAARAVAWGVQIEVRARRPARPYTSSEGDLAGLDVARQLAEICAGKMVAGSEDETTFSVTVTLPALQCLPVLVIDDNVDALQLMQRYVTGTRYRLITTRDPEQALTLAEGLMPQIIVLDVMMPQVDGWKVLGRLRQHPRVGHIPMIVCTILPHEALALSLGADAFVRKPITRRDFLAALDRQVSLMERESG